MEVLAGIVAFGLISMVCVIIFKVRKPNNDWRGSSHLTQSAADLARKDKRE